MSKQKVINNESKYGDDNKFEPWSDVNIFFPIATKIVDPLYNLGLTPNMVTILSTVFTLLSIYFLHINKRFEDFTYLLRLIIFYSYYMYDNNFIEIININIFAFLNF